MTIPKKVKLHSKLPSGFPLLLQRPNPQRYISLISFIILIQVTQYGTRIASVQSFQVIATTDRRKYPRNGLKLNSQKVDFVKLFLLSSNME